MDSITHLAIGACLGEALAGKRLGKKAMLFGAVVHSIPDIDFVASFWMTPAAALLAHRGLTHSFLFCLVAGLLFGLLARRFYRSDNISLCRWSLFFIGLIFTHIFIDAFNNYGVGWFEPFSNQRISFNAIYVVDPLFSLWPGIACIVLIFLRRENKLRKKWWQTGLGLSGLYLLYCLFNKAEINIDVKRLLQKQQISYTRYFTTPAPLQSWLWFVVAGDDNGYFVGYRSVFDRKNEIDLKYFPRNDYLLKDIRGHKDIQRLIRFSRQFYTIGKKDDTLIFNDLRFGQVAGWEKPDSKFVFHYFLRQPEANNMVVQRGRFEGWNWQVFLSFWERIKGI